MSNLFEDSEDPVQTVFQAVGAASMAWEHIEKAGVFNDQKAVKVANDLIDRLVEQGVVFP